MNIVTGTKLLVDEPVFAGGSFYRGRARGASVVGRRQFAAVVERESYGASRGQHTFTLRVTGGVDGLDPPAVGSVVRRKGRTLYRNAELVDQPDDYELVAADKAARAEHQAARNIW
jgi:hypothetical protein